MKTPYTFHGGYVFKNWPNGSRGTVANFPDERTAEHICHELNAAHAECLREGAQAVEANELLLAGNEMRKRAWETYDEVLKTCDIPDPTWTQYFCEGLTAWDRAVAAQGIAGSSPQRSEDYSGEPGPTKEDAPKPPAKSMVSEDKEVKEGPSVEAENLLRKAVTALGFDAYCLHCQNTHGDHLPHPPGDTTLPCANPDITPEAWEGLRTLVGQINEFLDRIGQEQAPSSSLPDGKCDHPQEHQRAGHHADQPWHCGLCGEDL